MKVTDILAEKQDKTLISFEILPPLKGKSIDSITKVLDPLMEFQPPFIDVTYHREEFEYKQTAEGYFEKVAGLINSRLLSILLSSINLL